MAEGITGTLDPDDLHVVLSKIIDAKTKAEYLGLALGLSPATVESICQQYGDRQDRLLHILKEYLKKVDPDPTWKVIAEALRSPTVDFPYLAKRIINEKIPTQQLSDQGSRVQLVKGQETSRPSSTLSAGRDHDLEQDALSESQSTKTSDPGSRVQPVRGQETTSRPSSTPSAGRDLGQDAHSESQSTKTSDPGSRIQPVRGQETTSRPSSTPSAGRDHDLKKDAHSESQSTKTSDPGSTLKQVRDWETSRPSYTQSAGPDLKQDAHSESQRSDPGGAVQPVRGQETSRPPSTPSAGRDLKQDALSESQSTKTSDPGSAVQLVKRQESTKASSTLTAHPDLEQDAHPAIDPVLRNRAENTDLTPQQQEIVKALQKRGKKISLMLVGTTGNGKSTLINSFLGLTDPSDSIGLDDDRGAKEYNWGSGTDSVSSYKAEKNGIIIECWDTPGFEGATNAANIIAQMSVKTNGKMDILLYCIKYEIGMRVDDGRKRTIREITKAFKSDIWQRAVCVMTMVNMIRHSVSKERHISKLEKIGNGLRETLRENGVPDYIASNVPLVTAGYEEGILPYETIEWMAKLFGHCLDRLNTRNRTNFSCIIT